MTSQKRRAAGRRRAWGRGPVILRFESLEGRQLLTTAPQPLPDLVGSAFATSHKLDWGDSFHAVGTILNQGNATANAAFNVRVYASTTPTLNATSIPLGEVTIPAGLEPNKSSQFDQVFSLPPTAIPNYQQGDQVYIALFVDPDKKVAEINDRNNQGVGNGNDISPVTITPRQPSLLLGSALGVTPTQVTWGQTITVTAQIRNNAAGDAPATRARLMLTPTGLSPGSDFDHTIGYLNLPAIPAWQTVNAVQQIKLPDAPPSTLGGGSQFTLSMSQDADYVTDLVAPHVVDQGMGLDMTPITINANPNPDPATPEGTAPLPDLAPTNVTPSAKSIFWGYAFQVSTTIENLGPTDSGPVDVRFLLTGTDGNLDRAIFLGEATLSGLAANTAQDITQTLQLPNRLPSGVAAPNVGRIAVVVDPDHATDESLRSNNNSKSSPVNLRIFGLDGTSRVPTSPPVGTSLGEPRPAGTVETPTPTEPDTDPAAPAPTPTPTPTPAPTTPAGRRAARIAAAQARAERRRSRTKKLHRQAPPKEQSLTAQIEDDVKDFFDDLFG